MKKPLAIIVLAFFMAACDLLNSDIDGEKVNVDVNTHEYTFKENGQKVTGTVIFYKLDPKTAKKYKESFREVKEGKRIKTGYDYFPNGAISSEIQFDENGLISGTVKYFYPNGQLSATAEFKENKLNGLAKGYRENGIQAKETIFEAGKQIKDYEFDERGNRIIPAWEQLELVTFKTGFFEYINLNSNQILYQPMVIMKWRNITDQTISDMVKIEGIFIDNSQGDEEMAKEEALFLCYSDNPLQPNLSRQRFLQSRVGFTNVYAIINANVSCQIFINKQLFKTVKIENHLLTSNQI